MRRSRRVPPRTIIFIGCEGKSERALVRFLAHLCEEACTSISTPVRGTAGTRFPLFGKPGVTWRSIRTGTTEHRPGRRIEGVAEGLARVPQAADGGPAPATLRPARATACRPARSGAAKASGDSWSMKRRVDHDSSDQGWFSQRLPNVPAAEFIGEPRERVVWMRDARAAIPDMNVTTPARLRTASGPPDAARSPA